MVLRIGERAAVRLPTSTMVVSRTLRQYFWERHGAETSYVPNGGLMRERRPPDKILAWGLEPSNYILFLGSSHRRRVVTGWLKHMSGWIRT